MNGELRKWWGFLFDNGIDSTIQPSDEELRDLYSLANNVPFDDRVNHFAELNDLNITLIQQYLRKAGSSLYAESGEMDFVELCRNMGANRLEAYENVPPVGMRKQSCKTGEKQNTVPSESNEGTVFCIQDLYPIQ